MNFAQKLRYSYVVLLNLVYAWIFPKFGLKLSADASIGFYLRYQNPKLYRRYYKQYYAIYSGDMPTTNTTDILDIILDEN